MSRALVATEGWVSPFRWSLVCEELETVATAPLAPVAARYRTTLALNLAAMALALVLGFLVTREARQRALVDLEMLRLVLLRVHVLQPQRLVGVRTRQLPAADVELA